MERLSLALDKHKELIGQAFAYLWQNPETGFKEWKSHAYLADQFRRLGYAPVCADGIPGFYADVDTGRPGPMLLVLGELDGLICAGHPQADPETGAAHACGHCAQTAALLGLAAALREPGALERLSGRIRLMCVPAEELIEVGYRQQLREQGIIRYFGGKPELLRRGMMDGVDLAFMIHTSSNIPAGTLRITGGSNGNITKQAVFRGVAAHAGSAPHKGVNALYAATQGLSAINALRETFPEEAGIRVHPILTEAGRSVNAIPDYVSLECYVRGADMDAVAAVNYKVNRALAASAASLGARIEIQDELGYYPRRNEPGLMELMRDAGQAAQCTVQYMPDSWGKGCSDMGDLSTLMPTVHPYIGGASGASHSADYHFSDGPGVCLLSAKIQAEAVTLLLEHQAARAERIIRNYQPVFPDKEAYFAYGERLHKRMQAVCYHADGSVTLLPQMSDGKAGLGEE